MNLVQVHLKQGSIDWLNFRFEHLGASDAPIIMGESPWRSPHDLFKEKTERTINQKMTPWMKRGIDLEPIARNKFIEEYGFFVEPKIFKHEKIPYMMASFDGVSENGRDAIEIKCPGKKDHQCALNGQIPSKYKYQLYHQMEVLQLEFMYYLSFNGISVTVLEIFRDEKEIKKMLDLEVRFWEKVLEERCKKLSDYN